MTRSSILALAIAATLSAPATGGEPKGHAAPPPADKPAASPAAKPGTAGAGQGHAAPAESPAKGAADGLAPDPDFADAQAQPAIGAARLPGFSAVLAQSAPITDSSDWAILSDAQAWGAIAASGIEGRQAARWYYAKSLIGRGLGAEAIGVLAVMLGDDDDLSLVPQFQLARGAAFAMVGRADDALAALAAPSLVANPEACAWRVRAAMARHAYATALSQVNCALPAINRRKLGQATPFVLAASRAALGASRPRQALQWLRLLPDREAEANLLRGTAYAALGEAQASRLRLNRADLDGSPQVRAEARLVKLESEIAARQLSAKEALDALDQLRFTWRGGEIEERALRTSFRLASEAHDDGTLLRSGAALFRYFDLGTESGPMLARVQEAMASMFAPDSATPITEAAGLFWNYRELAPAGASGDLLVTQLANRLQSSGLYTRAAELLDYQLSARAEDVMKGPLSVRVATLHILAGDPKRAIDALRRSEGPDYPREMIWDRKRIEAVALDQLGKTAAALAALDEVPNGYEVRHEILWKRHDWKGLAEDDPALPRPGTLSKVDQAVVLRHAIALAMLGREDRLAALRKRYEGSFAALDSAPAFDLLTRPVGSIDATRLSDAMAAIPVASPAGAIADLIAVDPTAARTGA